MANTKFAKTEHTALYYLLPTYTDDRKLDLTMANWQVQEPQLDQIIKLTESMKKGLSAVQGSYPGVDILIRLIGGGKFDANYLALIRGKNDAEYESALSAFIGAGLENGFIPTVVDGNKQLLEKILNTYNLTQRPGFPGIGRSIVKLNKE
jgi:hypothetical protein